MEAIIIKEGSKFSVLIEEPYIDTMSIECHSKANADELMRALELNTTVVTMYHPGGIGELSRERTS